MIGMAEKSWYYVELETLEMWESDVNKFWTSEYFCVVKVKKF